MNQNNNHYVMLHDEKRCIGCQACTVACRVLNDVPVAYSRLQVQIHLPEQETEGRFRFVRISCQHCADAPCVSVCPTGASFRDDNGIVQVDKSRCIGCDYCVAACPFHVRYLDPRSASRISATSAATAACRRAGARLCLGLPDRCAALRSPGVGGGAALDWPRGGLSPA